VCLVLQKEREEVFHRIYFYGFYILFSLVLPVFLLILFTVCVAGTFNYWGLVTVGHTNAAFADILLVVALSFGYTLLTWCCIFQGYKHKLSSYSFNSLQVLKNSTNNIEIINKYLVSLFDILVILTGFAKNLTNASFSIFALVAYVISTNVAKTAIHNFLKYLSKYFSNKKTKLNFSEVHELLKQTSDKIDKIERESDFNNKNVE